MGQDQSCSSPKLRRGIKETRGEKEKQNCLVLTFYMSRVQLTLPVPDNPERNTRMSFQISSITSGNCIRSDWKWWGGVRGEVNTRVGIKGNRETSLK